MVLLPLILNSHVLEGGNGTARTRFAAAGQPDPAAWLVEEAARLLAKVVVLLVDPGWKDPHRTAIHAITVGLPAVLH